MLCSVTIFDCNAISEAISLFRKESSSAAVVGRVAGGLEAATWFHAGLASGLDTFGVVGTAEVGRNSEGGSAMGVGEGGLGGACCATSRRNEPRFVFAAGILFSLFSINFNCDTAGLFGVVFSVRGNKGVW